MKQYTCPCCWIPLRNGETCTHPICVAVSRTQHYFTRSPIMWSRILLDGFSLPHICELTYSYTQGEIGGAQDGASVEARS